MTPAQLLDLLVEVSDYLDDRADVDDGEDGRPVANRAMRLKSDVDALITDMEREVTGG